MKVLVTGGGGFLGRNIVKRLIERGDTVSSFSRGDYPELREMGVTIHRGDLADREAVSDAAKGRDLIFHVAAKVGVWGKYSEYYDANVVGAENVVAACREWGIKRLVYTSTPSVIYHGEDIEGADESLPYPSRFEAHYPQTKALAEQKILAANDAELATVALRPHLIWGVGDTQLVARVISRAKSGRLFQIGTESKLIDTVYIDNAVDAHLLAADRLFPESEIAGKVYFITNGEPLPVVTILNKIVGAAGLPPISRTIPTRVAYFAGWLAEGVYGLLGKKEEPTLTRFLAQQLSTAHWFDISAARHDLDYEPQVSIDEGIERLKQWLK